MIGSIFLVTALLLTIIFTGHSNLICLENFHYSIYQSRALAFLFALGLWSKVPVFPLHIWLPEVHGEASGSSSVILASLILKLGCYGLMRFTISLFALGSKYLSSLLLILSLIGTLTSSINCARTYDIKKLVAYSSISHINFTASGLFTLHSYGQISAIITLIAHGLSSALIFSLAAIIYDRTQSRNLISIQALWNFYPSLALIWFIAALSNLSFPSSINFLGELITIYSLINIDATITALLLTNIFLCAC